MKTKLRALGLPYVTGTHKKPVSGNSDSIYDTAFNLTEIYVRDVSGSFRGHQLGIQFEIYIPTRTLSGRVIAMQDLITANSVEFEISAIQLKDYSLDIEDHYYITAVKKND